MFPCNLFFFFNTSGLVLFCWYVLYYAADGRIFLDIIESETHEKVWEVSLFAQLIQTYKENIFMWFSKCTLRNHSFNCLPSDMLGHKMSCYCLIANESIILVFSGWPLDIWKIVSIFAGSKLFFSLPLFLTPLASQLDRVVPLLTKLNHHISCFWLRSSEWYASHFRDSYHFTLLTWEGRLVRETNRVLPVKCAVFQTTAKTESPFPDTIITGSSWGTLLCLWTTLYCLWF